MKSKNVMLIIKNTYMHSNNPAVLNLHWQYFIPSVQVVSDKLILIFHIKLRVSVQFRCRSPKRWVYASLIIRVEQDTGNEVYARHIPTKYFKNKFSLFLNILELMTGNDKVGNAKYLGNRSAADRMVWKFVNKSSNRVTFSVPMICIKSLFIVCWNFTLSV
jgi:hypothetical protein